MYRMHGLNWRAKKTCAPISGGQTGIVGAADMFQYTRVTDRRTDKHWTAAILTALMSRGKSYQHGVEFIITI